MGLEAIAVAAIPALISAAGSYAMSQQQSKMQEKMASRQMDAQQRMSDLLAPPTAPLATSETFAPPPPALVSPLLGGEGKNVLESPSTGLKKQEEDDPYKKLIAQGPTGGMGV